MTSGSQVYQRRTSDGLRFGMFSKFSHGGTDVLKPGQEPLEDGERCDGFAVEGSNALDRHQLRVEHGGDRLEHDLDRHGVFGFDSRAFFCCIAQPH